MDNQVTGLNEYMLYLESIEKCDQIIEQILQEKISVESLKKRHKEFMEKGKKLLKDNGISVTALEAKGKAIGSKFKGYYEQGKTPRETSKSFLSELNKLILKSAQPIVKKLEAIGDDVEQKGAFEKIAISMLMFMIIVVINSAIMIPLIITFGPVIGSSILTIIVAPFVEEAAKAYFVSAGLPWTGTAVVFGLEFVMYVMNLMAAGATITSAVIVRAFGLMMHFATTYIQKILQEKGKEQYEPDKYMFAGWVAGVALHMTWNTLAMVYNKEIATLMGI